MIRGADFESMSDTGVLWMSFSKNDHFVAVTIGDRNGDMAGPVYEWRINKSGRLVLSEDRKALDEFELIRFSPSEIEVRHNWQDRVIYRRRSSKNPNGEQDADRKPDNVVS